MQNPEKNPNENGCVYKELVTQTSDYKSTSKMGLRTDTDPAPGTKA